MKEKVDLPQWHFAKRVPWAYDDLPKVIAREIVQNSQDAGASTITVTIGPGYWIAQDDGCGMTADEFRKFYLTLGGTNKQTGSIGGFGIAKEVLSFAWSEWSAKGQNFIAIGEGAVFEITTGEHAGRKKGFRLCARDDYWREHQRDLYDAFEMLVESSDLRCDVQLVWAYPDGSKAEPKTLDHGRRLRWNQVVKEYDFGTLYVHKGEPGKHDTVGYLAVRTRGLLSFRKYVGGSRPWYLNLEAASPEVLTDNRDALRRKIDNLITREIKSLEDAGAADDRSSAVITLVKPGDEGDDLAPTREELTNRDLSGSGGEIWADGRSFGINTRYADLWRDEFAIAVEGIAPPALQTASGEPRPKLTHALEVWDRTLRSVCELAGLEPPVPGLYFGDTAEAIHLKITGAHIVAAHIDLLNKDAYTILDCAQHELAHYDHSAHGQHYEQARSAIARKVGSEAFKLLTLIEVWQKKRKRRGRYWLQ